MHCFQLRGWYNDILIPSWLNPLSFTDTTANVETVITNQVIFLVAVGKLL